MRQRTQDETAGTFRGAEEGGLPFSESGTPSPTNDTTSKRPRSPPLSKGCLGFVALGAVTLALISLSHAKAGLQHSPPEAAGGLSLVSRSTLAEPLPDAAEEGLAPPPCAKWREDRLIGKCFGLEKSTEIEGGREINSWRECRQLCCELGDKCVTWQWQNKRKCLVGGPVRLGLERADTGNWCEPTSPSAWTGMKVETREGGTCTWGEDLPYQCFG